MNSLLFPLLGTSLRTGFGVALVFILLRIINIYFKSEKLEKTTSVKSWLIIVCMYGLGYISAKILHKKHLDSTQNTVWTKEYEEKLHEEIYKTTGLLYKSEKTRTLYSDCATEKIKKYLPGGLESVSQDSLYKLMKKTGYDCAQIIKEPILWSNDLEISVRKKFLAFQQVQALPIDERNILVDCYLEKLKYYYPESLPIEWSKDITEKIRQECNK